MDSNQDSSSVDNTKSNPLPDSTIKSVPEKEFSSSDSESSDFDREYTCDVCDKSFSGLKPFKQHEKSGTHLKALRKQKLMKSIEDEEEEDDSSDDDLTLSRNQVYKECEVCLKEFNGPESYRLHMRSKRHKKKMANSKILEMSKEEGKVNVDKLKQILKMNAGPLGASAVSDSPHSDDDPLADVYKCDVCDKVFSGLEPFRDHMTSKIHRKTNKQKKLLQNLSSADPENTIKIADGDLFCLLCHYSFSGPESALAHLKSKGHLEWIEFKKWKRERKYSDKQEPAEASTSAESSGRRASNDKEPTKITDDEESAEIDQNIKTKENESQARQARITYKKYKDVINNSEMR